MPRSDLWYETFLIGLTLVIGGYYLLSNDEMTILVWWIFFGFLQLVHSFTIANIHWKQKRIRNYLIIYWTVTTPDLLLLFFGFAKSEIMQVLVIGIVPSLLALYLWYITFVFREKKSSAEEK